MSRADSLRRALALAAVAMTLAGVYRARAEGPPEPAFTGFLRAGSWYSSADEYPFGEYTGLGEDEWNVDGDFELRGRPAWDSGDAWHFLLRGENLGLDSRSIEGVGGIQGLFRLHVSWDQIPHLLFDDGETIFSGRGTDLLTLPSNWIPGTTTKGFTNLGADLDGLRMSRERRDLRAGSDVVLPHGFSLSTNYLHDRQLGRKPIGSVIGNTGGNPRAVIIPQPIDWRTQNGDVTLRYASGVAQGELGYEISHFDDQESSLTWQNPYSAIGGWDPAAGYPTGFGRRGAPPDNQFHQIKASGGYDLPLPFETRIMTHAAFGWMLQDDSFEPYTVNPALAVTTPLPRNGANAEIKTHDVGVRLTSRPLDHLRATAEWRLDDRDNDTPRDTYIYVPGDSLDQSTIASDRARINLPESYRRNDGRVDLEYEIFDRTSILAGYRRLVTERSWTEADQVKENEFRAGVNTRPIEQVAFRVDGKWSARNGGDYFYNAPLVWGFSPEYLASPGAVKFENNPQLRNFTFADRDRQSVDAHLDVMPIESLTLSAQVGFANEDYDASELGLRKRRSLTWTFDASWTPIETLTAYAYYSKESFHSQQRGRSFSSEADAFNPIRNWRQQDGDDVETVGTGLEWAAIADRLTLRADFVYSRAKDSVDVQAGSAIVPPAIALPTADSRSYDVSVSAEVKIVAHLKARVGYMFESYEADNWALDGVAPNTLGEVLTLGEQSPNYSANLVGLSFEYEF